MSNFNKKPRTRIPTSQSFGLRKTTSTVPKPLEKKELTVIADKPPSYEQQDQQKGVRDNEAEDNDKIDEQIRVREGKNAQDVEQTITTFKPATKEVVKNDKSDQGSTSSSLGAPEFEMFWAGEVDYDLETVIEGEKNTWTPNALAMFEILNSSHTFVADNRIIIKKHPEYLDYAVACYYSILFYIQILRAKKAAGLLVGEDSSFFRRFERKFALEELPMSRIMLPYFSTIVATLLSDSKYNWITPDFAAGIFSASDMRAYATRAMDHASGGMFLQPMVPYMLSILRTVIHPTRVNALNQTMAQATGANADSAEPMYFNNDDEYIPGRLSGNANTAYFGVTLRTDTTTDNMRNSIFWASGISYPFHADADTIKAAAPKWRKSSFKNLGNGNDDTLANNLLFLGTKNIRRIDEFLCMDKDNTLEWFEQLIYQAGIHARFFGKCYTMSDVPTTGGDSTLITCLYKRTGTAFANAKLGHTTLNVENPWYPQDFRGMLGSFYTTRNGSMRQEILQAMTFGTNGTLPVGASPHRVGEDVTFYRKGPYWTNKQWTATKFENAGTVGKPMFKNWYIMLQQKAALEKPEGY